MNLETKKTFNTIRKDFIKGDYSLDTLELMVEEIRESICELNKNEFKELISIPLSVLKQGVYITNYKEWQKENSQYFIGNLYKFDEKFFLNLKNKIYDLDYHIEDMIDTVDYISQNFNELILKYGRAVEIPLRNVEVTFRDIILIDKKQFMNNGDLFAKTIGNSIHK